jgi:predicted glycosyltransferase
VRVWLDLANSPHPLIFEPIARRLAERGATVAVTARDHAQTAELAHERWPDVEVIGEPSPGGLAAKVSSIAARVRDLRAWARRARPDVALSHNSYAQLVAARSLRIPAVTAMDYEHQPANHLAFRSASLVLVPEALPTGKLRRQGARSAKVIRYRGFKEQLYLDGFRPDAAAVRRVAKGRSEDQPLVVARAAPAGAVYHRSENAILLDAVRRLASANAACVVLTRSPAQRDDVAALGLANVSAPEHAIDARSLVAYADLFVGAGGTMTREAALMGVPTVSVFEGRAAAVDTQLMRQGRLRRVTSAAAVGPAVRRDRQAGEPLQTGGGELVDVFADATLATAG